MSEKNDMEVSNRVHKYYVYLVHIPFRMGVNSQQRFASNKILPASQMPNQHRI